MDQRPFERMRRAGRDDLVCEKRIGLMEPVLSHADARSPAPRASRRGASPRLRRTIAENALGLL